jgi:hypothetical protein
MSKANDNVITRNRCGQTIACKPPVRRKDLVV